MNDTIENTITGAEFRCIREELGLSNAWLSDYLGVAERSVVRWGDNQSPIPEGVADEIRELEQLAEQQLAEHVAWLTTLEPESRELITYRTDDVLAAINPGDTMPASWHRAIAARVRRQLPGVRIEYAPED